MFSKVAVIIVNYNGLKDTVACIESLLSSSCSVEIIVVDNASMNDEAVELHKKFPQIHVLREEENRGFSYGNNVGISYALNMDIEYVLLLNNDTIVDSHMIEFLLGEAGKDKVLAPYMYYFSAPDILWFCGGYINKFTGNTQFFKRPKESKNRIECDFITGCCMLIPKTVFTDVGYLEEKFFMYCEDTELCIRLKKHGYRLICVPKAKLWHKIGRSSQKSGSEFSIYYITRNRLFFLNVI